MKDLKLLVWLTQLGISAVLPLCVLTGLAFWLKSRFSLGNWVLIVGIVLGVIFAIHEFYYTVKLLDRVGNKKEKKSEKPPIYFNEHE